MEMQIKVGEPKKVTMPGYFDKDTEIPVTLNSITSGVSSCIVSQGGFTFMPLIKPCVLDTHNHFVKHIKTPNLFTITVRELDMLLQELHEYDSFRKLNAPTKTVKQFSYLGEHNDINPDAGDTNFIDLGALTRNVLNQIIIDHQLL